MRKIYLIVLILTSIFTITRSYAVNNNNRDKLTTQCDTIDMDNLIKAIISVESSGNAKAISQDGQCVGILQIKKIVVDDCNEFLRMKKSKKRFSYEDRFNKDKSIQMFLLIQERYKNFNRHKSKSSVEHAIRLWNGGCGYNIKSTQKYYNKVLKLYKKREL